MWLRRGSASSSRSPTGSSHLSGRRPGSLWQRSFSTGGGSGRGRPRGLRGQRSERGVDSRSRLHLRGEHARGRRRNDASPAGRLPSGSRPRARRVCPRRARSDPQHDDRGDQRHHDAPHLRRRRLFGLLVGVASLVARRRHGEPRRGAVAAGSRAAPLAGARQKIGRSRVVARAPGGGHLGRLPRRPLALSTPGLPAPRLGGPPLPSTRRAVVSSFVVTVLAVTGAVRGTTPIGEGSATEVAQIVEGLTGGSRSACSSSARSSPNAARQEESSPAPTPASPRRKSSPTSAAGNGTFPRTK